VKRDFLSGQFNDDNINHNPVQLVKLQLLEQHRVPLKKCCDWVSK